MRYVPGPGAPPTSRMAFVSEKRSELPKTKDWADFFVEELCRPTEPKRLYVLGPGECFPSISRSELRFTYSLPSRWGVPNLAFYAEERFDSIWPPMLDFSW